MNKILFSLILISSVVVAKGSPVLSNISRPINGTWIFGYDAGRNWYEETAIPFKTSNSLLYLESFRVVATFQAGSLKDLRPSIRTTTVGNNVGGILFNLEARPISNGRIEFVPSGPVPLLPNTDYFFSLTGVAQSNVVGNYTVLGPGDSQWYYQNFGSGYLGSDRIYSRINEGEWRYTLGFIPRYELSGSTVPVPEPATLVAFGCGLLFLKRRRARAHSAC